MTRRNLLLAAGVTLVGTATQAQGTRAPQAPELIGTAKDWVSGKPVSLAALKGKVVVVCFWTFGCINCKRTLPFWNQWAQKYADKDVVFVTIHTPELESERVVENVKKFIEREKLVFPVLIDNNMSNWKTWQQQYWPATYILDRKGRVRGRWDGELDYKGSGEHKKVERGIELLRNEK
ncbi:redoxin domain-containing protein [Armatimonas sp.]|uniref:redoxin domain-containing protein n=1 Tax=Armatimonas sp. TaxID=1872638 RepID=UPI00286CCBCE|nr:redoxin domain-containing protein [Armatimonas sp.]